MAVAAVAERIYTIAEYLEMEKTSEIRHEFVYGKLIPMSGESKIANDIALNCAFFLRQLLSPKGFRVFVQSIKVQVDEAGLYRYPDVVVVPQSDNADPYIVTQPVLLIEVVSAHSAARDRVNKLREYARIPSLQQYLIVDQYETLVESYHRTGDHWAYVIAEQPDAEIVLRDFSASLLLTTIYEGVAFEKKD